MNKKEKKEGVLDFALVTGFIILLILGILSATGVINISKGNMSEFESEPVINLSKEPLNNGEKSTVDRTIKFYQNEDIFNSLIKELREWKRKYLELVEFMENESYVIDKSGFVKGLSYIRDNNEWVADVYDCTEMGRDGKLHMKSLGWNKGKHRKVKLDCDVYECYNGRPYHRVTEMCIWVDYTVGRIISPEEYKDMGIR